MWHKEKTTIEVDAPMVRLDAEQLRDLQTIQLLRDDIMHLDAMRLQQVVTEKRFKQEKQIIENTISELERKYGISD